MRLGLAAAVVGAAVVAAGAVAYVTGSVDLTIGTAVKVSKGGPAAGSIELKVGEAVERKGGSVELKVGEAREVLPLPTIPPGTKLPVAVSIPAWLGRPGALPTSEPSGPSLNIWNWVIVRYDYVSNSSHSGLEAAHTITYQAATVLNLGPLVLEGGGAPRVGFLPPRDRRAVGRYEEHASLAQNDCSGSARRVGSVPLDLRYLTPSLGEATFWPKSFEVEAHIRGGQLEYSESGGCDSGSAGVSDSAEADVVCRFPDVTWVRSPSNGGALFADEGYGNSAGQVTVT